MSRVGKLPIVIPNGVKIEINVDAVSVIGPKGTLSKRFNGDIYFNMNDNILSVVPANDTRESRAMWGTARNIINWMVKGVTEGFVYELEVNGVGYRAAVKDNYLNLTLGKSHNTKIEIPSDITLKTPKQNVIILEGINKERLGQFIAVIIKQRPPEPYKGKGIRLKGQYVQRKDSKKN